MEIQLDGEPLEGDQEVKIDEHSNMVQILIPTDAPIVLF